jgi:branched-chain amino acid transport system substrate-binding protein
MKRILAIVTAMAILALAPAVQAAEPIKIGAFFALSGPAAHIGSATEQVAKLVVKKINDEGGVLGRPIELVTGDTEGKPTKAVMVAKKLISRDNVVAIVGPSRSGSGMAVKKQVEKAKVPIMMTVGADAVLWEGKHGNKDFGTARYIFKTPQRSSTVVQVIADYLNKNGMKKVAILTASDGFGKDGLVQLRNLIPKNGLELVGEEQFNATDVDMKPQLTKIAAASPDAIIVWTIGPAASIISKNHHSLGIKAKLFMNHGTPDPKYIKLAGAAAEGDLMPATKLMTGDALPDSDPQKAEIMDFITRYKAAGLEEEYPLNTHSGYAWDAIRLFAMAIEKAKSTDPSKIRDALETIEGYVGISGIYKVTAKDHNGLDTNSMVILDVKDGKFVLAQ